MPKTENINSMMTSGIKVDHFSFQNSKSKSKSSSSSKKSLNPLNDNSKNLTLDSFIKKQKAYKNEVNTSELPMETQRNLINNCEGYSLLSNLYQINSKSPEDLHEKKFKTSLHETYTHHKDNISNNFNNNVNTNLNYTGDDRNENYDQNSHNLNKKFQEFVLNNGMNALKENLMESIVLVVDNREKGPDGEKFPDEIRRLRPDIKIREENLALGDFLWIYLDPHNGLEYVLDFIIERKIIEDLAKSILDGRYNEQKYRLKNCGINNVYYIFEGASLALSRGNISKSALTTAIFHTINIHDINIVRSLSIEDTVQFLIKTHDFIFQSYGIKFSTNHEMPTKILFSEFTSHNAKTKNSSVENIFVRQLRCFDDCGAKSVEVLKNIFKCPRKLFEIMKQIDDPEMKENLIIAGSYLYESELDVDQESILLYANPENFKTLKKEIKSVKKIRKTTGDSILNFYS